MVNGKVMAEGYTSIKPVSKYLNKENSTLIIDIGLKTTDVILVEWDGKFKIVNYGITNIALYDMYKVLQDKIAQEGVEVSIE